MDKSGWQVLAPQDHPLGGVLREAFAKAPGGGVVVCLPEAPQEEHVELLLDAARKLLDSEENRLGSQPPERTGARTAADLRFVVVQHGWGGGAFARTLHLENPAITTCVLNVPPACPQAAEWILAEALSATGYTEARYDLDGHRSEPRLMLAGDACPTPPCSGANGKGSVGSIEGFPVGPQDVLLVTGGGKGIAAECALALAREMGVHVALLGRSDPQVDPELAENLARIEAAQVRCCYVRADVTDPQAVQAAVTEVEAKLGPITAVLHGAGTNTPQLIEALKPETFRATLAPKIRGLANVLAAINQDRVRLLVTFGSLIARTGLRGEADYGTANEWLTAQTEQFQARHPACRCLALEWSVWSGVGMGQRLGRIETLVQQGITPITPDEGVRILLEALRHPPPRVAVVITGRCGATPTLKMAWPEIPLRRFLERERVHYPGVELVVDIELSREKDLYLEDHVLQQQRLFPAVMGLEAMAQAAMVITGSMALPSFEQVELKRPVAISDHTSTTIRIAALRRGPGRVEVCLRSEETDYQVDHFRACCQFGEVAGPSGKRLAMPKGAAKPLGLDPQTQLYGRILFHTGRFQRLRAYQFLTAKECLAEIAVGDNSPWFGPYLPQEFVLGDPGGRDATLHAIQACIPHQRILPTGIERLSIHRLSTGPRSVHAIQRERHGQNFVYDLEVIGATGELLERWEGLRLRAVEALQSPVPWPLPLLVPYLGRRLEELSGDDSLRIILERGAQRKGRASARPVLESALGRQERVWRRPGGKPIAQNGEGISAAHAQDLTLAVAGPAGVACDLEAVAARSGTLWQDLLGAQRCILARRIAEERSEAPDVAETRLWAAMECLKKSGLPPEAPVVLESTSADGWVLLRSGRRTVLTCVTSVLELSKPIAIAVGLESRSSPLG